MTRFVLPVFLLALPACRLVDDGDGGEPGCTQGTQIDQGVEGDLAITSADYDGRYHAGEVKLRPDLRLSVDVSFADLLVRRPATLGVHPLDAEVCSVNWESCTRIEGTIEVSVAEPRTFEARIVIDEPTRIYEQYSIEGEGRVRYAENDWTYCWNQERP